MATTTITMMSFLPPVIDFVGEPVRAAGYFGPTSGIHTFQIKTLNFQGTLFIEGSMLAQPSEADWFPILLGGHPSLTFPTLDWDVPSFITPPGWEGQSGTFGYTVTINCVLLRARMARSNLIPYGSDEYLISTFGSIDSVKVRYWGASNAPMPVHAAHVKPICRPSSSSASVGSLSLPTVLLTAPSSDPYVPNGIWIDNGVVTVSSATLRSSNPAVTTSLFGAVLGPLPVSDPGIAGQPWLNNGALQVSSITPPASIVNLNYAPVLPDSDPCVSDALWINGGVLTVSSG